MVLSSLLVSLSSTRALRRTLAYATTASLAASIHGSDEYVKQMF